MCYKLQLRTHTHTHTCSLYRLVCLPIFGLIDRLKALGLLATIFSYTLSLSLSCSLSCLSLYLYAALLLCLSVKCTNDFSMATILPYPTRLRPKATTAQWGRRAAIASLTMLNVLCPSAIKHIYINFYIFARF